MFQKISLGFNQLTVYPASDFIKIYLILKQDGGRLSTFVSKFKKQSQPRSQGLRGETVTKTLVKFVLSFQNFGKKIACAVRHNRIAITVEYGCVSLRMRFFSQNFGTIKRILPGSSSPSHREGPGTEVETKHVRITSKVLFDKRNNIHCHTL